MVKIKEKLYKECVAQLVQKRDGIESSIQRLQVSLASESKSTAGDKHETGRAMIQLEREKLGHQLQQLELQEAILKKTGSNKVSELVVLGSYVETNTINYYLSVSLGKLIIEGEEVFAISAQSPIGRLLLGKKVGDSITFNTQQSTITKIC